MFIRDGDKGTKWTRTQLIIQKSEGSIAGANRRPRMPWNAARTTKCYSSVRFAIAQQLVYHAVTVPTAVRNRVTKTMSVAPLVETTGAKEVQLLSPAPPPTVDVFWANLKVQHHLPPLDLAWTRKSVWLLRENPSHLPHLDLARTLLPWGSPKSIKNTVPLTSLWIQQTVHRLNFIGLKRKSKLQF